jgi:hypothetical protein
MGACDIHFSLRSAACRCDRSIERQRPSTFLHEICIGFCVIFLGVRSSSIVSTAQINIANYTLVKTKKQVATPTPYRAIVASTSTMRYAAVTSLPVWVSVFFLVSVLPQLTPMSSCHSEWYVGRFRYQQRFVLHLPGTKQVSLLYY